MNERGSEQLDKILALADSSHDGEAVVAVRKARQMLSRDGLSFGDLARAAARGNVKSPGVFWFWSSPRDTMESEVAHLRRQLEDLQEQMRTQELQLEFWRRRASDLDQTSSHAFGESERWKNLAKETAERLWDLGQSLNEGEFGVAEEEPPAVARIKK